MRAITFFNQLAFENGLHHRIPAVILSRMVSSYYDEDTSVIYLCQLLYYERRDSQNSFGVNCLCGQ